MTLILLIVILAVLILIHETGHFVAARWAGMWVEEFGVGFPPRIWSKRRGETEYSVNLFPVGGFVKIYGENPVDAEETDKTSTPRKKFSEFGYLQRAGVLFAGVAGNWLLAWLLISLGLMIGLPLSTTGRPAALPLTESKVIITSVLPDSLAEKAGLQTGDEIKNLESVVAVQEFIKNHDRQTIVLSTQRGEIKVQPEKGLIGVALDQVGLAHLPFFSAFWWGAYLTVKLSVLVLAALGHFFAAIPTLGGEAFSSITGPVGLFGLVGEAKTLGWIYLISLTAVISINLAVVNLLPIPALDGGRLFLLGLEALTRRPLSEKWLARLSQASFFLLLLLLAIVTYQDIWRLVR